MLDITLKIDGRDCRLDQIGKELEKAAMADLKEQIQREVSRIRCPIHGQVARVRASGQGIDRLSWEIDGCCDDLVERVKKVFD